LKEYSVTVDVYDPWVDAAEALNAYGITTVDAPEPNGYDGIILAVAHHQFVEMGSDNIRALGKSEHVLYDLKYVLTSEEADMRL
jgi:UDP-N-acetyl-D-galactosamine dehydrogenase